MKKNRVNILLNSLIIVIFLLGIYIYNGLAEDINFHKFQEMSMESDQLIDTIDYWFVERSMAVISAKNMLENVDNEDFFKYELNNPYLDLGDSHDQTQMYLGVSDGRFLTGIDWSPGNGYNPVDRIWYQMAKESEEVIFTPHYIDAYTYDLVVTAATKLTLFEGEEAVIAIDFRLEKLNQLIVDAQLDTDHSIYIIDQNGEIISSNRQQNIGDSFDEAHPNVHILAPKDAHEITRMAGKIIMSHPLPRTKWLLVIMQEERLVQNEINRVGLIVFSISFLIILILGILLIGINRKEKEVQAKIESLSEDRDRFLKMYEQSDNLNLEYQTNFRVLLTQLINPLETVGLSLEKVVDSGGGNALYRDMVYTIDTLLKRLEDVNGLESVKKAITEEQVLNVNNLVLWIKTTYTLYAQKINASLTFTIGKNLPNEILLDSLKTQSIFVWLMSVLSISACEIIDAQIVYEGGRLKLITKSDQVLIIRDNEATYQVKALLSQIGGIMTRPDDHTIIISVPSIIYDLNSGIAKESMFNNLLYERLDYQKLDGKVCVINHSKYNEHVFKMVFKQLGITYDSYSEYPKGTFDYDIVFCDIKTEVMQVFKRKPHQILIAIIEDPSVEVMTKLSEMNCTGYIEKPLSKDKVIEKLKMYFYDTEN